MKPKNVQKVPRSAGCGTCHVVPRSSLNVAWLGSGRSSPGQAYRDLPSGPLLWEFELTWTVLFCVFYCRELQREKAWSRIHLVPLLMAEGDRDAFRREQAALAREREIMKDVPGWEVRAHCQRSHDEILMLV